jgi:hypothetical protein
VTRLPVGGRPRNSPRCVPENVLCAATRSPSAGLQILLDALEAMSEIEADYSRLIGASDVAELKRLLARLLDEIDPAGALHRS